MHYQLVNIDMHKQYVTSVKTPKPWIAFVLLGLRSADPCVLLVVEVSHLVALALSSFG